MSGDVVISVEFENGSTSEIAAKAFRVVPGPDRMGMLEIFATDTDKRDNNPCRVYSATIWRAVRRSELSEPQATLPPTRPYPGGQTLDAMDKAEAESAAKYRAERALAAKEVFDRMLRDQKHCRCADRRGPVHVHQPDGSITFPDTVEGYKPATASVPAGWPGVLFSGSASEAAHREAGDRITAEMSAIDAAAPKTRGIAPATSGALAVLQHEPAYCSGSHVHDAAHELSTYHAPTPQQTAAHTALVVAAAHFLAAIVANTPPGPERSTAISHARTAKMWARAAVALEGK